MNKFIYWFVLAVFSSTHAFASSDFDNVPLEECPGAKEIGSTLVCFSVEHAKEVWQAQRGRQLKKLPKRVAFRNVVELGIWPDDGTDSIYSYTYELVDRNKRIVGYISIDGYRNSEMGSRIQLTTRYNARGQLASVNIK